MPELDGEARQLALEGFTVIAVFESSSEVPTEYRGELSENIIPVGDPNLELSRALTRTECDRDQILAAIPLRALPFNFFTHDPKHPPVARNLRLSRHRMFSRYD